MNPSTKADFPTPTDSPLLKDNLCEVCSGTSDEDLYIVFNVLYKVVVGENFYETSLQREKGPTLDSMSTYTDENAEKYMETIQENLSEFRKKLCSQELVELVGLPRFDLLLREIFKSKYNRLQETVCKHKELAKNFIKKFNLRTDVFFEESDFNKTKLNENTERIDVVYNSVKQFKSEIESYHDQINGLSDKVLKKLISKKSGSRTLKNQENNERKETNENKEKELFNPFVNKKLNSDKDVEDYKPSSLKNRRVTSSTNSRESRERTPDFQDLKGNSSKMAVFKSKLPKRATDVLKDWFLSNIQNPYPHHEAKEMLSKATGLTRKQIQNWFTNSRKRFLEPLKKKIEGKKGKELSYPKETLPALSLLKNVQEEPKKNLAVPQPFLLNQSVTNVQTLLKPTALSPNLQSIVDVNPSRTIELEKNLLQSPLIAQNIPISRTLPTIAVQPANNIMVLPLNGSQSVYPFNPNIISVNTPQLVQVPQNAFLNGFPFLQTSAVSSFPYFQPVQANPNINEAMRQQLLNQFTPMTPQIYPTMFSPNMINPQGLHINQERSPHINNFIPFANQPFINSSSNMNNSLPDFLRKK